MSLQNKKIELNPFELSKARKTEFPKHIKQFTKKQSQILNRAINYNSGAIALKDTQLIIKKAINKFKDKSEKYESMINDHYKKNVFSKKVDQFKSSNIIFNRDYLKPFEDLVTVYKEKQYKIPDMSLNKNVFSKSGMIMENNQIEQYYGIGLDKEKALKDLKFFTNMKIKINKRMSIEDLELLKINENMRKSDKAYPVHTGTNNNKLNDNSNGNFKAPNIYSNRSTICVMNNLKNSLGNKKWNSLNFNKNSNNIEVDYDLMTEKELREVQYLLIKHNNSIRSNIKDIERNFNSTDYNNNSSKLNNNDSSAVTSISNAIKFKDRYSYSNNASIGNKERSSFRKNTYTLINKPKRSFYMNNINSTNKSPLKTLKTIDSDVDTFNNKIFKNRKHSIKSELNTISNFFLYNKLKKSHSTEKEKNDNNNNSNNNYNKDNKDYYISNFKSLDFKQLENIIPNINNIDTLESPDIKRIKNFKLKSNLTNFYEDNNINNNASKDNYDGNNISSINNLNINALVKVKDSIKNKSNNSLFKIKIQSDMIIDNKDHKENIYDAYDVIYNNNDRSNEKFNKNLTINTIKSGKTIITNTSSTKKKNHNNDYINTTEKNIKKKKNSLVLVNFNACNKVNKPNINNDAKLNIKENPTNNRKSISYNFNTKNILSENAYNDTQSSLSKGNNENGNNDNIIIKDNNITNSNRKSYKSLVTYNSSIRKNNSILAANNRFNRYSIGNVYNKSNNESKRNSYDLEKRLNDKPDINNKTNKLNQYKKEIIKEDNINTYSNNLCNENINLNNNDINETIENHNSTLNNNYSTYNTTLFNKSKPNKSINSYNNNNNTSNLIKKAAFLSNNSKQNKYKNYESILQEPKRKSHILSCNLNTEIKANNFNKKFHSPLDDCKKTKEDETLEIITNKIFNGEWINESEFSNEVKEYFIRNYIKEKKDLPDYYDNG